MLKLVSALALGLFAAPSAVEAQPAGKVTRVVGYLTQGSAEDARSGLDAFRIALRELGYVEGETITSSRDTRRGRPRDYLLLVTGGAALDARKLTSTIPIVVVAHPDPVGAGLVASLARRGCWRGRIS